jgi:AcrR family transcriptional regulator
MSQKFGSRQKQAKEETRRIIFDTAYTLFEKKGYEKVTMRDLASEAGVGIGTIFQHFNDKATLLISVFEHEFQPYVDQAFKSIPKGTLKKQLLYLTRKFYTYYATKPQIAMILLKEIYIDPKNSDRIKNSFVNDIGRLEAMFEAAQKRGEISPETSIGDAVTIWWSYYSFILLQALQSQNFDVEACVNILGRLFDQHIKGIGIK